MFLSWLVIADQGISVDDYCWPSKVIELKGHTVSNQTIEVNTREYLEYLTEAVDPKRYLLIRSLGITGSVVEGGICRHTCT